MTSNNEPSYREKGRSLFLAALMVMSVFAMSAAFAGGAAAAEDGPDAKYTSLSDLDNSLVYAGQTVQVDLSDENVTEGDDVQIRVKDGSPVVLETADGNSTITFDTADLDTGEYELTGDNISTDNSFEVVVQNVDASFSGDTITNDDSDSLDLNIESSLRNQYNVTVNADGLNHGELATLFNVSEDPDA